MYYYEYLHSDYIWYVILLYCTCPPNWRSESFALFQRTHVTSHDFRVSMGTHSIIYNIKLEFAGVIVHPAIAPYLEQRMTLRSGACL